jgi:hypothetical protein
MPKDLEKALVRNGFLKSVIQYEDIHHYTGTAPDSMQSKMIESYRKVMRMLPEQYSKNKFLMLASR